MCMCKLRIGVLCLVAVVLAGLVGAREVDAAEREPAAGRLDVTTTRVVVFKDGHALFIRRATGVADANGQVFTHEVPDAAILGTFWAFSEDVPIRGMRSERDLQWQPHRQPVDAQHMTIDAMITRSAGKSVTLHLDDGTAIEGELRQSFHSDAGRFVIIDTLSAPAPLMIEVEQIVSLSADHLTAGETVLRPTKRMTILLDEAAANAPVDLTLMHFAPGIRWIPTYRIAGGLVDDAAFSLQAELLNESQDLENVTLDLVAGIPNFRFKDAVSPLSLEATLQQTLQRVAPQLMGQRALFDSRAGERMQQPDGGPIDLGHALPDDQQELHVYRVENFSLNRGGRATASLWDGRVPLRHLYTFDAHLIRRGTGIEVSQERPSHVAGLPDQPLVWHQVELTNTSDIPWTTGAAMIMRQWLPMGQDLLTQTPPGATTLLPVTVAVNIRARIEEEEIEREAGVMQWSMHRLTRVRKRGEITLINHRNESSPIRLNIATGGRAENLSHGGRARINDYHAADWQEAVQRLPVNQRTDMIWELELEPGETRTLTYELMYHTR